jgi:hypothetical protein
LTRDLRLERIRLHHLDSGLIAEFDVGATDLRRAIAIGRHDRARRLMRIRRKIFAADEYAHCNEYECGRTDPKLALAGIVASHVKKSP